MEKRQVKGREKWAGLWGVKGKKKEKKKEKGKKTEGKKGKRKVLAT